MISLQDAQSRAGFMLLVFESLILSVVPKTSYWQKLFPRPLLQLVTLKSQLGAVQRSSWSFWKQGSSGASHVVLDGSVHARLLQPQLGNLTTLGTLPSMGITNMMLWWLTSAEETSKGGKSAAYVSHNIDATRVFESTERHHRLFYFH